jgi:hypothetical protein
MQGGMRVGQVNGGIQLRFKTAYFAGIMFQQFDFVSSGAQKADFSIHEIVFSTFGVAAVVDH